MIAAMPRPRPPYVQREVTRHGRVVWFVRIGKGARIRIRADYGTPEFAAAYQAILAGQEVRPAEEGAFDAQTLGWLIQQYRESSTWAKLAPATRQQRDRILRDVIEKAGRESFKRIEQRTIEHGMKRRNGHEAWHFLKIMRGLFRWAVKSRHAVTDPTADIRDRRPPIEGHPPWPQEWCEAFERCWPRGTRERVAYDIFLFTGLRLGDAVRLGRPHVRAGEITIRTEKSGGKVTVTLPIVPPLQHSLDIGPIGELTFIVGENGRPIAKKTCADWFRKACRAAAVPGSPHGLRKTAATRMADNGASEAQLEAVFGWHGGHMASLYTREANRAKLARGAALKLMTEREANLYSRTSRQVRAENEKP